jgi:Ca2+-binding RTX toxin-like protein
MKSSPRRSMRSMFVGVLVALLPGCASEADENVGTTSDALGAVDKGAGAGPARFEVDPCENPRAFARAHGYNLIEARAGDHTIVGTEGRDLIVGTAGDDEIWGKGGADVICAGEGEDTVHGGDGDDYIDGGGDNDKLFGDAGNDLIHGRGGSDVIHGGGGDDQLFGDILDDHIFGDEGNDLLVGGHGTDILNGGPGNDYLRGDTGNDAFIGGEGTDIASFATAMPPGQGDTVGRPRNAVNGVKVDFTNECADAGDIGGNQRHDGCANGDGGNEPLDGIEIVIGSPYDDAFIAGGKRVRFIGGYGDDRCDGNPCGAALPPGAGGKVFVTLASESARDTGLVVRGTKSSDNIDIVEQDGHFRVRSNAGTPLYAGPGCRDEGADVICKPKHVLRWIAAWMDDGSDVVKLAEAAGGSARFPIDMTAHVNGGNGDDFLHGGDEEDVFFSGPTGEDHLFGNRGDDALLSESRKWPKKDCSGMTKQQQADDARCTEDKPDAAHYSDGADDLFGGPGNDQLVSDYPCGGHHFSGGGGKDIAGFARSGRFAIHAQLAGRASVVKSFHGRAFNPQLCGVAKGTRFADDLEILEAADGNDELWGNDDANIIWGREGDDRIHGLDGNDTLEGLLGDDSLFGGAGEDKLLGARGNNRLFQDAD